MEDGGTPATPEFLLQKRPASLLYLESGSIKYQALEKSDSTEGWPLTKQLVTQGDNAEIYKPLKVGLIPFPGCRDTTISYKRAVKTFANHLKKSGITDARVTFRSDTKTPETDIPIMYNKFENYMGKQGWEIKPGEGENTYLLTKTLKKPQFEILTRNPGYTSDISSKVAHEFYPKIDTLTDSPDEQRVNWLPLPGLSTNTPSQKGLVKWFNRYMKKHGINKTTITIKSQRDTEEADVSSMYNKLKTYMTKKGWEVTPLGENGTVTISRNYR